jgi:parvulin-like peptidyl-prolyl isomerase
MRTLKIVPIALVALITLLAASAGVAQTVNAIVAVVNGQIITLLDVEVAAAFGLVAAGAPGEGGDPRLAALERLIDHKIVLDLAREVRNADRSEMAAAAAELRRSMGEEAFAAKLARFGLSAESLEPYLEERILYERALAIRFSQAVPVSVTEIERHYRDIYVPERTRQGLAVEPLEQAGAGIETRIREERRAQQMQAWIRDLRKRADIQIRKDRLK